MGSKRDLWDDAFNLKSMNLTFDQFLAVDMRVGTVIRAELFPEARRPAIKLWIDFGPEIGERKTSAQITDLYQPAELVGRQLVAVVNFPPKQIGKFMSECLVLGSVDANKVVTLLSPDRSIENGLRIG
jgi:tRNA-binding protein